MQGMVLLEKMLREMNACLPEEFLSRFGSDISIKQLVSDTEWPWEEIFTELTKDQFWEIVAFYPWLLDLISPDGEVKSYKWNEFLAYLPGYIRMQLLKEIDFEILWLVLKLFIWLFYAPAESVLEIDFLDNKSIPTKIKVPSKNKVKKRKKKGKYGHSDDNYLDLYLEEIAKTPLLKKKEEVELAIRIQRGDKKALDKMVSANLRFVVSVARNYQYQGLSLGDLIAEGNIGLIKAAKRFDHARGFKFISYAVWWIRQAILDAMAKNSRIVRLPLNRVGTLHKINKMIGLLQQDLGRSPSPEEIAKQLELSEAEVHNTIKAGNNSMSLDRPLKDTETDTLYEVLEDEDAPRPYTNQLKTSLQEEINNALGTLNPREAEVMELYFGLNGHKQITLEEIGSRFSLTRERIRQIKELALRKLRHASRARILRGYFTEEFSEN